MAQLVLEFGAEHLEPILNAVTAVAGDPTHIEIDEREPDGPIYVATTDDYRTVSHRLKGGALGSAVFRTSVPGIRYALITSPQFCRQPLSLWMGTLELTQPDWEPFWKSILEHDDLVFACIGYEEGVELSDSQLAPETFPWEEWPLVIGAVRNPTGRWIVRSNPAGPG